MSYWRQYCQNLSILTANFFIAEGSCFEMTMQEFGTAAQYAVNIVVIISGNCSYGTIRMHQEWQYPSRVSGIVM